MAPRKRQQENPPENHSENQQDSQSHKKPRTRGASLLKNIAKDIGDGNRLSIELNNKGQPTGKNTAKLSNYIGTTVKKWVPITVDNWKMVSAVEKNAIWEDVLGGFILPDDLKDWVLKKANELWRTFKKDLGRLHMNDKETGEILTEPPAMYDSYVTQDQWTEFVKIRQSEEFKGKSDKFRQLSQQNDYTYRASRKGYAGIEAEYKAKHNMDASSNVARSILWMEARKEKSGEYCAKAQPIIEKLHHYMEQEASRELTTTGQQDVLALALDKPEHPGRVRGIGQDVSISQYWPRSSKGASSSKTDASAEAVISGLMDQIKVLQSTFGSKIEALENIIEKLVSEKQHVQEGHTPKGGHVISTPAPEVPCPQSGKASCSVLKNVTSASKDSGWKSCELFWTDLNQAVARGKVYSSSIGAGVLHNRPLESGCVRVEVITLIKGDVVLPYPTDEVTIVRDAIGQFIAWPEHLVIPIEETVLERPQMKISKEKVKGKSLTYESVIGPSESESEASKLENYQWVLDEFNGNNGRQIKVATEIFQYKHPGLGIGKEEIRRLLDGKEIGASHVMLYIRYLFENHCKGVKERFKFICPTKVSPLGQSIDERAVYLANCMEGDVKDKIFVAPYHFRYHWVLILMNPQLGYACWIDPRHEKVEKDAELLVTLSYRLKYSKLARRTQRKQTLWHVIQCPRQENMIDCGYYVLKFMRTIILCQNQSSVIPINWYDDKTTYKHEDIDEVRKEWLDYFLSLV